MGISHPFAALARARRDAAALELGDVLLARPHGVVVDAQGGGAGVVLGPRKGVAARRAKAFTFLRDPLRRVASQYEHHLAGGRVDVLRLASPAPGQDKRAKFPTSKAPFSAVFHSFRLIFGRAIISRNGLEAWMLFSERARAEHSR